MMIQLQVVRDELQT